jgi:hypothetical protein
MACDSTEMNSRRAGGVPTRPKSYFMHTFPEGKHVHDCSTSEIRDRLRLRLQLEVQRHNHCVRTHALYVLDASSLHAEEVQRSQMSVHLSFTTTIANAGPATFICAGVDSCDGGGQGVANT